MSSFTQYLSAFAVGGMLCVIGQLLISLTRLTPARVLVIFVTSGVALTVLGLYEPLVRFAGAGATVPLTGFGYSLAKGAMTAAAEEGLLGALTGGIKATAAGISAAIAIGYLIALIFRPATKS
ncbi:MAG: stage V sporulation protein AE [Clostridia bacterium]|nr:stage V sporulation protein AE [Clostridia bacterium]